MFLMKKCINEEIIISITVWQIAKKLQKKKKENGHYHSWSYNNIAKVL